MATRMSRRGPGRPSGATNTREAILAAALAEFGASGYSGTTIRGIARAAGVDPALVHHYFGSKDRVFIEALQFPFDPAEEIPRIFGPGPEGIGERLLRFLLRILESPETQVRALALIRTAVMDEEMAALFRDYMVDRVIKPNISSLGMSQPEVRAACTASQVGGMVLARYVMKVEPLASAAPDEVVRWIAPTLQRYLAGEL